VISVLENAEMVLRASVERKESRRIPFGFYRADFPDKNDQEYFTFLGQRLKGKGVEFSKVEIKR
jgi:succinate dehydrogenase/fumarate reductase flavoprotein subunit